MKAAGLVCVLQIEVRIAEAYRTADSGEALKVMVQPA